MAAPGSEFHVAIRSFAARMSRRACGRFTTEKAAAGSPGCGQWVARGSHRQAAAIPEPIERTRTPPGGPSPHLDRSAFRLHHPSPAQSPNPSLMHQTSGFLLSSLPCCFTCAPFGDPLGAPFGAPFGAFGAHSVLIWCPIW